MYLVCIHFWFSFVVSVGMYWKHISKIHIPVGQKSIAAGVLGTAHKEGFSLLVTAPSGHEGLRWTSYVH